MYEDLYRLLTDQLIRRSRRWRVPIPPKDRLLLNDEQEDESWTITSNLGYEVLKWEARQQLLESIWRRKLEVIAIFFGVSSLVQTIYTKLSYYRR